MDGSSETSEIHAGGAVYRGYRQHELDAQYEQRTLVPDVPDYVARWKHLSDEARDTLDCQCDLAYGDHPAEVLDFFPAPSAGTPLVVFVHGGAWCRLSKAVSTYPAPVFHSAGYNFAALEFGLVPDVTLERQVDQARRAVHWLAERADGFGFDAERLFVLGHSSGAHVTAMLASDRPDPGGGTGNPVAAALLLSGIYDLEPVRLSARNDYLRLDETRAAALSPIARLDAPARPLLIGWGDGELDEFKRQPQAFAAACRQADWPVETREFRDHNHFDVGSGLADGASAVARACLAFLAAATPSG